MKLTKKKLILVLKQKLESLGFKYVQDTRPQCQANFIMKVEDNLFLTLSLDIHRYYDSMFTCSYYLSPIILVGAIWGDIPKDSYTRPGFILSVDEFANFSKNSNVSSFASESPGPATPTTEIGPSAVTSLTCLMVLMKWM